MEFKENDVMKNLKLESISFEQVLSGKLSNSELRHAYTWYSYVVHNGPMGMFASDAENTDIFTFLREILHVNEKDRKRLDENAKRFKPPPYDMTVELIDGVDLIPTDADQLSDPYCCLWMNNDIQHKKRTATKENTRNPEWNEEFVFPVNDAETDTLHLEIWDEDPESFWESIHDIRNVTGFYGCWLFCKDICGYFLPGGKDDFMGHASLEIKSVFPAGENSCLVLESKKGSRIRGSINISTHFEIIFPKDDKNAVKLHLLLCRLCLLNSFTGKEHNTSKYKSWEDILNQVSFDILHLHGAQCNVTWLAQHVCEWLSVYHFLCMGRQFSFILLFKLLTQVRVTMAEGIVSEIRYLQDAFEKSLLTLLTICFRKLQCVSVIEGKESSSELEHLFRCINLVKEIRPNVAPDLINVLKVEALKWYEDEADKYFTMAVSDVAISIFNTLHLFLKIHSCLDDIIKKIFTKVSYSEITYKSLSKVISMYLRPRITEVCEKSLSCPEEKLQKIQEVIDVYSALKQLYSYLENKTQECTRDSTELQNFRDWFPVRVIQCFFEIKGMEINSFLKNGSGDHCDISPNIVVSYIESKLGGLWDIINWPIPEYISAFVNSIHDCSMKYSGMIINNIENFWAFENFECDEYEKICIAMNDLWRFAYCIADILDQKVKGYSSELPDSKKYLERRCEVLCCHVAGKIQKVMSVNISKISEAQSITDQEKAMEEYRTVIHVFFDRSKRQISHPVFVLCLQKVWKEFVTIIADATASIQQKIKKCFLAKVKEWLKPRETIAFNGLYTAIQWTEDLFDDKGCGLDESNIYTPEYKIIKEELKERLQK